MDEQEKPSPYIPYNFRFQIDSADWDWLQKHLGPSTDNINTFLIECLARGYKQLKKVKDEELEKDQLRKQEEHRMQNEPAYMRRTPDHAVNSPNPKQTSWDFWKKDK